MKWSEFRDFVLVGLLVFNICLIALIGHINSVNTAKVRALEIKIIGLESAVDVGIAEISRAAGDLRTETIRLSGVNPNDE